MASFKKGYTYILYSEERKHWYLVRQVSMKTWVAVNFTNVDMDAYDITMKHNGVELWSILKPRDDYKMVSGNATFRKAMYEVLMYGHFKN